MKNSLFFLVFTLIFSNLAEAQSTDKFIRIIGNAQEEVQADRVKVEFGITEIKANTYNQTEDKAYETVYDEVVLQLEENGFGENQFQKSYSNLNRGYNANSGLFILETAYENLEKIMNVNHPGFRVNNISYIYSEIDENLESKLSLIAIEDAKRKANFIADKTDKKLGQILNIEVREGEFSNNIREKKEAINVVSYRVTITFQLNN